MLHLGESRTCLGIQPFMHKQRAAAPERISKINMAAPNMEKCDL